MKREILAISVSCVILAGAILVATFYCQRSHRFVHVSTDPKGFIMFDTKTKMSCWSGPRNLIDNFMKQQDPSVPGDSHERLPLCSEL